MLTQHPTRGSWRESQARPPRLNHSHPARPVDPAPMPEMAAVQEALSLARLVCLGRRPMVTLPRVSLQASSTPFQAGSRAGR
jgi:hypothetical protein